MFKRLLRHNTKSLITTKVDSGKVSTANWINNFFKIVRKYNTSICRNWKAKLKFKRGKTTFETVHNLW